MSPAAIFVTTIMGRGPGNRDPEWQWSRPAATSGQDRSEDTDVILSSDPVARSRGRQSPAIGMGEAVQHEADRGQGDHRLGDLG